jgi:signal transduction histidine kinase
MGSRCGTTRKGAGGVLCYVRGVTAMLRGRADLAITAMGIAALAFFLGLGSLTASYDSGLTVVEQDGRVVVSEVEHLSQAERDGIRPGLVVVELNGYSLLQLPMLVYGEYDPNRPDEQPPVVGTEPATPLPDRANVDRAVSSGRLAISSISLISPDELASGTADNWPVTGYWYPGAVTFGESPMALLPGLAILLAGAWWLQTGRFGSALRDLAIPLAVATSVPFLVLPLTAIGSFAAQSIAGVVTVAGMLPLTVGLIRLVEGREERQLVVGGVAVLIVAATAVVLTSAMGTGVSDGVGRGTLRWLLLGSIPLLPGLAAAGPLDLERLRAGPTLGAGGLLRSTELALAGATPLFAVASDRSPFLVPLGVWLLGIFAAARFTVRPLARLATRATLQRDLVVAATEAERARLAADIHDDALQELTLLVRRLEASGDTEGADIGRTVADRLRAICGDLRLPILDDLGVGPALDWLVLRIERLAGGEVRLERSDDARHSPDVELAIFRVAQEALANAVKHGSPPIVVRYRSTVAGISLAIDDAGPGITDDAPAVAERAGRFGLLNMAQRAEQIGAILDVKRWPTGGTHVALEWRPR